MVRGIRQREAAVSSGRVPVEFPADGPSVGGSGVQGGAGETVPASTAAAAAGPVLEPSRLFDGLRRRTGLTRFVFDQFLGKMGFVDCRDGWLTLAAPDKVTADWVRDRYEHHILAVARDLRWDVRSVRYHVRGREAGA